jgi:hypothetical protein
VGRVGEWHWEHQVQQEGSSSSRRREARERRQFDVQTLRLPFTTCTLQPVPRSLWSKGASQNWTLVFFCCGCV